MRRFRPEDRPGHPSDEPERADADPDAALGRAGGFRVGRRRGVVAGPAVARRSSPRSGILMVKRDGLESTSIAIDHFGFPGAIASCREHTCATSVRAGDECSLPRAVRLRSGGAAYRCRCDRGVLAARAGVRASASSSSPEGQRDFVSKGGPADRGARLVATFIHVDDPPGGSPPARDALGPGPGPSPTRVPRAPRVWRLN
jgi:hypothetical protein